MASGRARWASKKISAEHLTLPRQACHPRIGRSARSSRAGQSPASKGSQAGGGPRVLAVSNSNAHWTLRSPACRLRQHSVLPLPVERYVSQPYAGTCYRASNWVYLGQTQAHGAMAPCPPRRPRQPSGTRCSATGRRLCSHPNALPTPARRPPHRDSPERLSQTLAPLNLNAYLLPCPERVGARSIGPRNERSR